MEVAMRPTLATVFLLAAATVPLQAQQSASSSGIWYASVLKERFPQGIPIHGVTYALDDIPVLPRDVTRFQVSAVVAQVIGARALRVSGSLQLGAILQPFEVIDGAQGQQYMLYLQAYLFSPRGALVWEQQGFPAGGAWVQASGSQVQFMLIDAYRGSLTGHELLVIAAGDPIFSSNPETRVILGAIRRELE
jgi:hypothetical protein